MEKTANGRLGILITEQLLFLIKSGMLLMISTVSLYVLLAATYPLVHDALHNFRHALAVVPCH